MRAMVDSHKNKTLVLVGPVEQLVNEQVGQLKSKQNVTHVEQKEKRDIPRYIHNFDICINPFLVDQVSRHANPLKVYEYLACGKPVVAGLERARKVRVLLVENFRKIWHNPLDADYDSGIIGARSSSCASHSPVC